LEKRRAFKSEIQIPNYLKFYITKPLLRYDYTIINKALENPYEDSDDEFGDVEQSKPVTTGLTLPPKTSPNKGIKRILDDDDDFEEEFEAGDQMYYREEPVKVEPPKKVEPQWEPQTQTRGGPDIISITSNKPAQNKPNVLREEEEDGLISDEDEEEYMRGNSRNQVSQEKEKPKPKPIIAQPEIQKTVSVYPATIENPPEEDYYRSGSNYERERGRDRELLEKFERETESKIQFLQKEHYNEKRILQNRLEVLEEKYAIYVDMVSHPNQENVRSDNLEKTQSYRSKEEQNAEEEPRRERRRVKKEDDEFYKLHQQILQEREKVLQAEVDYKMHNRINLLGQGYKK